MSNRVRVNLFNSITFRDKNRKLTNEKQKTNSSIDDVTEREEDAYVIVSKLKNANDNPVGCKLRTGCLYLVPGMTLKLGRI